MYFNCGIKFNFTIYIGLPSTNFSGLCQDKNNGYTDAKVGFTSGVSVFQCHDSCKIRHDCVAFNYGNPGGSCHLMQDGPYNHGSGVSTYTCYIMQGKI